VGGRHRLPTAGPGRALDSGTGSQRNKSLTRNLDEGVDGLGSVSPEFLVLRGKLGRDYANSGTSLDAANGPTGKWGGGKP